jgi:hypothetical protein
MWSNEELDVEACVRSAERLPQPSLSFRNRVLDEALRVRHRSLSLHRIQTLTSSFLAASLLLFLPGYYHTLRNPSGTAAAGSSRTVATLPTPSLATADAYEWGLVQAALADRNESARIIRGAL